MKLTRITKLRHRVFRDFTWPSTLPDLGRFNVVYGWNGTGKTTLSSLLALLEERAPLTEGELELLLDDTTKVTGAQLGTARLPPARVFHRDFVAATLSSTGGIAPIYFLGEDSVEKQKSLEALRLELAAAKAAVDAAAVEAAKADERLDEFCVSQAKVLKALLTTGHSTAYNNYDKRKLKQAAQALTPASAALARLGQDETLRLRSQKDAQPKPTIESISAPSLDLAALSREVETVASRSVVAQTLDELTADPSLASWVHRGLALHSGEHASDTCRFCQQPLAKERRAALEAHFNDAFASFQKELSALLATLKHAAQSLTSLRLPEASRFYDALGPDVSSANEAVSLAVRENTAAIKRSSRGSRPSARAPSRRWRLPRRAPSPRRSATRSRRSARSSTRTTTRPRSSGPRWKRPAEARGRVPRGDPRGLRDARRGGQGGRTRAPGRATQARGGPGPHRRDRARDPRAPAARRGAHGGAARLPRS
ncbi:MAG: AAA family ATPase [Sandaracinus sp.]